MNKALRDQRQALERAWQARVSGSLGGVAGRPEVLSSWERSARAVSSELVGAPVASPEEVVRQWETSPLGRASKIILGDLSDLAADGDLMAAITDETVTIAWAAGGRTMTRRADRVHFMRGGCWDELAVGTNALALARHSARPAKVFSAEHYAPMVHDWVCYSAPVIEPESGRFLGVVDLSATWDRAHPAMMTTVTALAHCVEHELARATGPPARRPSAPGWSKLSKQPHPDAGLPPIRLTTLGPPAVHLGETPIAATRRQLELLTILALHPEGLTLDALEGRVYGDHTVSHSTVKAELSHLRRLLDGRIASRPYRLTGPVECDHRRLLDALAAGEVATAIGLYQGPLLVASDSPEIETLRSHIEVAVRDATLSARQPDLLYRLSERCWDDAQLQAATLDALEVGDARRSITVGRLFAARQSR